ncbi:AMP-binding protein [Maribacter sp. MAR_2009_72]|uniref:AMP-binding protein n=1 Tax=Maribacter sp. MAR_2009_72 TaxID=1250050 RepID=UPI00119B80C0|nr:AMP-binding protein [Maribacter sp. MAR_2009_72]TVZ13891.1 O-succinylbenzoic acid--CoA ligase [Maribacter sp. MAR_2009_72]
MYNTRIHPYFSIHSRLYSKDDLLELGYSLIKEGEEFEMHIGGFILDWIDSSPTILVKTSGSTGTPKDIALKKEQMVNSALATGNYFNLTSKSSVLLCLPATYIAGKMMLVRAMVLGLDIHFVSPTSSPLEFVKRSFDFGAMVPMQVANSLSKLNLIKKLIIGGAPISNSIREELKGVDNSSYETYGMTETITHIAVKPLNNKMAKNTPFTVLPNVEISTDARGCLVINAPNISDEPVITNDVVDIISTKEFYWLGRFDNVINSGGVKVHPEHIEKVISNYMDIPFFVAGIADEDLGEKVVLLVENGVKEDIKQTLDTITDFKKFEKPKSIVVLKEFIRTESGKIQRFKTLSLLKT